MKVFVTGGTGYIGRVLVPMLVENGYDVTVLDREFLNYDDVDLEYSDLGVKIIKDDIRYFEPSILRGHDAVVDLAALSNDPIGDLDELKTWDINYIGRARVGRLAKKIGVGRYIVSSSCSVYGFREDIADETSTVNPLTTYAQANVAIENDNLPLGDDKFTTTALRLATAFGYSKRMRFDIAINAMTLNVIKTGKLKLMRDGEQYRPFVHVIDISRSILRVLDSESDVVNGQIFNVGSASLNVKLKDLAEIVGKVANPDSQIEWYGDPDVRSYRANFDKIENKLNFKTEVTIEKGVEEIKDKLLSGELDDYPETHTVERYKKLMSSRGLDGLLTLNKGNVLL
jgi:nucleoside-diphosphate-sugar epimerase